MKVLNTCFFLVKEIMEVVGVNSLTFLHHANDCMAYNGKGWISGKYTYPKHTAWSKKPTYVTKLIVTWTLTWAFWIQGLNAKAAFACTFCEQFFNRDQIRRTPSSACISSIHAISFAHSPSTLVTFSRSSGLVRLRRLTRGAMPLERLMVSLLEETLAHSPSAPTTLVNTWKQACHQW